MSRERCFDCGHDKTFRRVRRYGDFIYFCRACDDEHEAASWWFWLDRRLHYGVRTYRAEERVKNELRGRLRWLLFKTTGRVAMRFLGLDEAAKRIGDGARVVLERLAAFEAKNGRKRVGNRYTAPNLTPAEKVETYEA